MRSDPASRERSARHGWGQWLLALFVLVLAIVIQPSPGVATAQQDAIERLTGRSNDLGAFTLSYLDQTGIATATDAGGWTVAYQYDAADRVTRGACPRI